MTRPRKRTRGRNLIFTLLLGMMPLFAPVGSAAVEQNMGQDFFALGNKAYASGNYHQAIAHYEAALAGDGYTSSLLYNLGNAYYMKKEIGQSILNYERALYLDPGNAQIIKNLALARKNFGLATPRQASWKRFFNGLTLNGWTWAGVFAFCVFSAIILLNGIRPGILRRSAIKMTACLCFLLMIAAGAGMVFQYGALDRGVVIVEDARLRVSPFDSAAETGTAKNGTVVELAKTFERYILINEANGNSGWLPADAVTAILPEAGKHRTQTSPTQSASGITGGGGGEPDMDKT